MMTYSGALINEDEGVPTLEDIALGLSRQPRFGGHTRRWWSVLDHSMFCHALALPSYGARTRLATLLHDAHESLTADIPTIFKSWEMKGTQRSLDVRIAHAYFPGGYFAFRAYLDIVKRIDRRALLAEARLVGPPQLKTMPVRAFRDLFGDFPHILDLGILHSSIRAGAGSTRHLKHGVNAPNVVAYVAAVESLVAQTKIAHVPIDIIA